MDENEIRAAVEDKKRQARESGIDKTVFTLYREHMSHWGHNSDYDERAIPKYLAKVSASRGQVQFCIEERSYVFTFNERRSYAPDDEDIYGTLEMKRDGVLLLQLKCLGARDSCAYISWTLLDIGAYREGSWVEEIRSLARQVDELSSQRKADSDRAARLKEVEDLKHKFGL